MNSFGFGGSNAHAILENHVPVASNSSEEICNDVASFTPFTFSANSEQSPVASLSAYSDYLRASQTINIRDLAWTLHARRSSFPVRTAFSAMTIENLCAQIDEKLERSNDSNHASIGIRSALNSSSKPPRILGIFTGQGAQYARMGAEMILRAQFIRDIIKSLEDRLSQLPAPDRPSWFLKEELLADSLFVSHQRSGLRTTVIHRNPNLLGRSLAMCSSQSDCCCGTLIRRNRRSLRSRLYFCNRRNMHSLLQWSPCEVSLWPRWKTRGHGGCGNIAGRCAGAL